MPNTTAPSLQHVTVTFSYDNVVQEDVRVGDVLLSMTDGELGFWLRQTIVNTLVNGPRDERVRNIYIDHAAGKHNHCTHIFCEDVRQRMSLRAERILQMERILQEQDDVPVSFCPACGQPSDYCNGHGESGDPAGFAILAKHTAGDHSECHPDGCDDAD